MELFTWRSRITQYQTQCETTYNRDNGGSNWYRGVVSGATLFAPSDSFYLRCTVSPQYKTSQTTTTDRRRQTTCRGIGSTIRSAKNQRPTTIDLKMMTLLLHTSCLLAKRIHSTRHITSSNTKRFLKIFFRERNFQDSVVIKNHTVAPQYIQPITHC